MVDTFFIIIISILNSDRHSICITVCVYHHKGSTKKQTNDD